MKFYWKITLLLWLLLATNNLLAQFSTLSQDTIPQDTAKNDKVMVDHSDVGEYVLEDERIIQFLKGHVQLRQDDVFMDCDTAMIEDNNVTAVGNVIIQQGDSLSVFADSLSYDGDQKIANLFGDVVLIDGDQKLFTNRLNYDLNTKTARYFNRATLTNKNMQLVSKRGTYLVGTSEAFFKDSVYVVDSAFTLRTDTLKINTKTERTIFLGPTLIDQDGGKIYCEGGFYDTKQGNAVFTKKAQYVKDQQKATADTIRYERATKEVILEGNARFVEDNKIATADQIRYDEAKDLTFLIGNARYKDEKQNIVSDRIQYDSKNDKFITQGRSVISDPPQILEADEVDFNSENGVGVATGNVYWQDTSSNVTIRCQRADYDKENDFMLATGGRPFLTTLIDNDTLFLASDTLISKKAAPEDTTRTLIAYSDVRLFKTDLQAICDSLIYSSVDSLFEFYKDPIIWSDTSQFFADTVHMRMADNQIDKIFLYQKSFIINTEDELFFNQIKGKFITAFFEENELRRMKVEGNAESVYYALNEQKAYVGVNKTVCSSMLLFFGNNKVDNIRFFAEPKATLSPMGQTNHETLKIEGFKWVTKNRPQSVEDLLKP